MTKYNKKNKDNSKSINFKTLLFILIPILASGCITDMLHMQALNKLPHKQIVISEEKIDPATVDHKKEKDQVKFLKNEKPKAPPPEKIAEEKLKPSPDSPEEKIKASKEQKKSVQEMLDTALEFCRASNDFWEQGDIENAITALDQAYSLILEINAEKNPDLLQQREDLRFSISKRIIEVYASRITVANGYNKAIPLVMNKHVERALSLFKGKDRKFFLDSYHRSGRYRPFIVKTLKEAGLPTELSWIPLIESGFKLRALSKARALGLWQFIASTGYKFGLERDRWIDDRMDPEKSTTAAIAYLKELHQIFGDWTTALAAYNCGEWRVLRCIKTQKINYLDNFWDLYKKLPSETAFYVPKFLAVLHILNDPEAHGFTLGDVEKEIEVDKITINKQVSLKTVSMELKISYKKLWNINPSLRHDYTPDRPFVFKMPKGKGVELLSKLDDMPVWHPPISQYALHKVRKGESLSVIARRYGTSVNAIMAINRIKSRHSIKANQRLKIPSGKKSVSPGKKQPLPVSLGSKKKSEYIVKKGDSLWKIARKFGTTVNTIRASNRLNNKHLRIGQVLLIPHRFLPFDNIKTVKYKVLKGDSLWEIARKHQMSLSEFLSLNNLTPRSTIFPGQVLVVKH